MKQNTRNFRRMDAATLSRLLYTPREIRPPLRIPERIGQPVFSQVFRYENLAETSNGSTTFTLIDPFGARAVATSIDTSAGAADFYPQFRSYRVKRIQVWATPGGTGTHCTVSLQTGFNNTVQSVDDALVRIFSDSSSSEVNLARVGCVPAPDMQLGRWHSIDSADTNYTLGLFKIYWTGSPRLWLDLELEYVLQDHSPDAYNIGGYFGTALSSPPTVGQLYCVPLDLEAVGGFLWNPIGLPSPA